jgi:hypothetical protein
MITQLELPSNGKKYGKLANFTTLKIKHFRHLSRFSDQGLSLAMRFSGAVDVLNDVIKIEGVTDITELYMIDFDALMLQLRILEMPESAEYHFVWNCDADAESEEDETKLHPNEGTLVLTDLIGSTKFYDNAVFRVGNKEFDFITVKDWLEVQEVVSKQTAEKMQIIQQLKANDPNFDEKWERVKIKVAELDVLFVKKLAAALKTELKLTLSEREQIVEDMDFKQSKALQSMLAQAESYGVQKYVVTKCEQCGREVRVLIPFQSVIKFNR